MMRSLVLSILALLASGCVHVEPRLPVCDGSERRPANPHGSILAPDAAPTGATGGCP
jgi:hypothetical protein